MDSMMVGEMLNELHLATYIRRLKTTAGYTLGQNLRDLVDWRFGRVIESLQFVAYCFPNQSEQTISYDDSFMRSYVLLSELLQTTGHIETIATTSPTSGWRLMNRYFAGSGSSILMRSAGKDERTESSPPLWTFSRTGTSVANESQYKLLSWTSESPPVWDLI
jgi:hypothetical protein